MPALDASSPNLNLGCAKPLDRSRHYAKLPFTVSELLQILKAEPFLLTTAETDSLREPIEQLVRTPLAQSTSALNIANKLHFQGMFSITPTSGHLLEMKNPDPSARRHFPVLLGTLVLSVAIVGQATSGHVIARVCHEDPAQVDDFGRPLILWQPCVVSVPIVDIVGIVWSEHNCRVHNCFSSSHVFSHFHAPTSVDVRTGWHKGRRLHRGVTE